MCEDSTWLYLVSPILWLKDVKVPKLIQMSHFITKELRPRERQRCARLHTISGDRSQRPTPPQLSLNLAIPADFECPLPSAKSKPSTDTHGCVPFLLVQIFLKFPQMRWETVSQSLDGSHSHLNTRKETVM